MLSVEPVKIRNAEDDDFVKCVSIAREAWPEFKERESIYHLFCKYFNPTSFVLEANGDIVAFVFGFLSEVDNNTAYIHLVATSPKHQRKGMATRLYQKFFETVQAVERNRIELTVNPDNAASLEFHRRLGFGENFKGETIIVGGVRAVRDYNGPGIHMVPLYKQM